MLRLSSRQDQTIGCVERVNKDDGSAGHHLNVSYVCILHAGMRNDRKRMSWTEIKGEILEAPSLLVKDKLY